MILVLLQGLVSPRHENWNKVNPDFWLFEETDCVFFWTYYSSRIPLVQSRQKFYSMDFDLRNNLKGWVETSADKFG